MAEPSQHVHSARLQTAVAVACISFIALIAYYLATPGRGAGDFDHLWYAARGLRAGRDPYAAATEWGWLYPMFYPLPAVLWVVPFSFLPLLLSRALFVALGSAALAYAVTRRGWWGLWIFASASYLDAWRVGQWSPWLVAAALIPAGGFLLAVKPTVGFALWTMRPSWRIASAAAAFVLLSLVIWPAWPGAWRAAVAASTVHAPPILRPGGVLLLLALLRWRRPEARLLATLAVVPHSVLPYETLLLFLVPSSRREMLWLVGASHLAALAGIALAPAGSTEGFIAAHWLPLLLLMYVPCLILILRRPNEAAAVAAAAA